MKTLKEIIVGELEYTQRCGDGGDWGSIAERIVAKYEKQKDMPKCIGDKCQDCVFDADCKDKQKPEPIKCLGVYERLHSSDEMVILNKLNEVIDRINKMEVK